MVMAESQTAKALGRRRATVSCVRTPSPTPSPAKRPSDPSTVQSAGHRPLDANQSDLVSVSYMFLSLSAGGPGPILSVDMSPLSLAITRLALSLSRAARDLKRSLVRVCLFVCGRRTILWEGNVRRRRC